MSRSYPLPITSKMKGGMLATGIGIVFLLFATVILDAEAVPVEVTAFYALGASSIVIGVAVFLRDFRLERKRRRHIQSKGTHHHVDWNPRIGVTRHRDPGLDTFKHKE